jgi:hypothetical protein
MVFAFAIMAVSGLSILFFLVFAVSKKKDTIVEDLGSISGGIASSLFFFVRMCYVAFRSKQQLLNQQIKIYHNKEELKLNRIELQNQQEMQLTK